METDVVIVGGGLAGLSLARKLDKEGIAYLLLEARDRLGGRILSEICGTSEQSPERHDLGPSWIWPGQSRISRLVRDLDLRVFPQFSDGRLVYEEADGRVRRDLDYATMAGSLRIEGGVASITDAIAGVLGDEHLRLSHAATKISRLEGGFELAVSTPTGEATIRSRLIVLALPPRVVGRTITFDPPLSDDVRERVLAVPTWMAGHAKLVAVYEKPFWRDMGLNGDGISRRGPLAEIHDATPASESIGALFGFVGVPVGSIERERSTLKNNALQQLEAMFGEKASSPVEVLIKDWAKDDLTATIDDKGLSAHPQYGLPAEIEGLADEGLIFASSEMGSEFGGLLEGALEAADMAARRIVADSGSDVV